MKLAALVALVGLLAPAPCVAQRRLPFHTTPTVAPSPGTGTVVLDCGTGGVNWPACTAAFVDSVGPRWTRTYLGAVGPQGQQVERIDHVGTADTADEYYINRREWTAPSVAQGACVTTQEIVRFIAPIDWNDAGGGRFGFKHIVIGEDGTNDVNRAFINVRSNLTTPGDAHDGAHVMLRIEKNVFGGSTRADYRDMVAGVWYFIQVEFCSSSTAVATDATVKVWVNNNTYASPTVSAAGGFAWPTVGWERVAFGFYGESLGPTHFAAYEIAGFVYTIGTTPGSAFNGSFYVP